MYQQIIVTLRYVNVACNIEKIGNGPGDKATLNTPRTCSIYDNCTASSSDIFCLCRMCCDMSDVLAMYLQMPKHALYSDAQLKYQELAEDFHNAIKVMERR